MGSMRVAVCLIGVMVALGGCDRLTSKYELVHSGNQTFLLDTRSGETRLIEGTSFIEVRRVETLPTETNRVHKWAVQKLFHGKTSVTVATKFRDGQLLYIVTAEPFKGPLFKARMNGIDPEFNLTLRDADSFVVVGPLPLNIKAATQVVDEKGEPQGLQWTSSAPLSLASYQAATSLDVAWRGFPAGSED